MSNTKTLYCQKGDHTWERPAQRGRPPINCPEHTEQVNPSTGLTNLEAARAAKANKKVLEEENWVQRIELVINDPRMKVNNPDPYAVDARRNTPNKLRHIQHQLTHNRNRPPHEMADLERMREKIMKDPFSRSGHLL